MFSHIFDAGYYTASLYAQPVLIVGTLLGALGIVVLAKERGSHVGLTFAFMTSSAALWLLASVAIYSVSFEQEAQVWTKVQMIGVVLIPSSIYIFTLTITQRLYQFRIWAWSSVVLSALFYLSIILTDEFITGLRRSFWGYSPQYGLLSVPFLGYSFLPQWWSACASTGSATGIHLPNRSNKSGSEPSFLPSWWVTWLQ
jgi:hypothetical protein